MDDQNQSQGGMDGGTGSQNSGGDDQAKPMDPGMPQTEGEEKEDSEHTESGV